MPAERLQKLLARAGVASRRGAERLIEEGRVAVDGRPAHVGESADPERQEVTLDGQPIGAAQEAIHYAVHKPGGFVSSSRDERGRPSVVRLLTDAGEAAGIRLWPAGRLDADSEGLLVLTNDGPWANRFLHPRFGVEREYAALVDGPPRPEQISALLDGVELEDGPARLLDLRLQDPPLEVERQPGERGAWVRAQVGEGRKREVRRIFAAVGLPVRRLVRVRFGTLSLDGLPTGGWRRLSGAEVEALSGEAGLRSVDWVPRPRRRGRPLSVAIDGPSGSGKSTIGHALAQRIRATFVDTGLMYRALTLAALERERKVDDAEGLGRLAREVRIEVRRPLPSQTDRRETVLLDGRDVTRRARSARVDRAVSAVSRHAAVRDAMLDLQRELARLGDTVMVGRDIGTVVLPDATLKVFLTATAMVRAARRAAEMGRPDRVNRYLAEIQERDAADSGRAVAPLRRAPDALVLDTGERSIDACVEAIVERLSPVAGVPGASA